MKNFLILLLGLVSQVVLMAQIPPDPGGGDNALPGGGLPIDQYAIVLIVALLGIAVWYYKKSVTKLVK